MAKTEKLYRHNGAIVDFKTLISMAESKSIDLMYSQRSENGAVYYHINMPRVDGSDAVSCYAVTEYAFKHAALPDVTTQGTKNALMQRKIDKKLAAVNFGRKVDYNGFCRRFAPLENATPEQIGAQLAEKLAFVEKL